MSAYPDGRASTRGANRRPKLINLFFTQRTFNGLITRHGWRPQMELDLKIFRMSRLGIPQERIAKEVGGG